LKSQLLYSHAFPVKPELHLHSPSSQVPLFEQSFTQTFLLQFSPENPSLHLHFPVAKSHSPLSLQLSGHSLIEQSSPM